MSLNRGQRNLLLLGIVFFAPVLVAYIVKKNIEDTEGFATKNYGDLIVPAKPLSEISLTNAENKSLALSSLHGKWVMVYLGLSDCNEKCKTNLYNIRQTRLGQRGEHKRIERVYISLDQTAGTLPETLKKEYLGMHFLDADKTSAAMILQEFEILSDEVRQGKYGVYIIDPIGNLMMRYPDGYTAKGLAKDLELLLKASQVG
jgi:cytochrome oxidase Cu insertion factor (SCO1/SenC/PrrC family)